MNIATFSKYLCWPMHTALLLLIISFALLLTLGEQIETLGSQAALLSIPLYLIITSWFFKYSFVLLDHVIDGRSEPPVLSVDMINPFEQRPMGMLLVAASYYLLTVKLESALGAQVTLVLRVIGLTLAPAILATMSITGSFVDALKPWLVLNLIRRIAVAYVGLLLTITLLWLIPLLLIKWLGFNALVSSVLGKTLFMYLWLAMMCCIGGIMYEQRDALGIEPVVTPERTAARKQAEVNHEHDRFLDSIFAQCRSGTFDKAIVTVKAFLEASAQPLAEFRWLYERTSRWPDQRMAARLVQLCLPQLLKAHANSEALDCVRERLRHSLTFRPDTATQLISVVKLARDGGDRTTARLLLRDFEHYYPNDAAASIVEKLNAEMQL